MTIDQKENPERAGIEGLTPTNDSSQRYDARDPRTGQTPNSLEAQRLADRQSAGI